jgi:hypothetical protein
MIPFFDNQKIYIVLGYAIDYAHWHDEDRAAGFGEDLRCD